MRVEGDNHEFDAQEGIGPVYDVCDVSPTHSNSPPVPWLNKTGICDP